MASDEADLTLYTFGLSHYCEKARWSLDLCGVPYQEVRWAPGPHLLTARRIAATYSSSSSSLFRFVVDTLQLRSGNLHAEGKLE